MAQRITAAILLQWAGDGERRRWEADGNRKPIGNRSRCASPGSTRSPGVPRCCWPCNTVQRRSPVRCLRGSRRLCWWHIALSGAGIDGMDPAQGQPIPAGVGGPASGAVVLPGAGFGQAGPGLVRPAPVAPQPEAWVDRLPAPGCSPCQLRAAGPRALNSWSRQVRHADPGWPPQLPEPSAPVRPRGSSLPVNPLGQLRQTQHLHPIGQRVTAVPRDRSRQRQRSGPDSSLGPAVD
jgi:hypothetical protein